VASGGGQLKSFDRRQGQKPTATLVDLAVGHRALNCVAVNTSQVNKIVTGNEDGDVTVWDLRKLAEPESRNYKVHDSHVWEVMFHPDDSNKVVSCSEDGTVMVYDWHQAALNRYVYPARPPPARRLAHPLSRLSINSVDVHGRERVLIAGSDSENLLFELAGGLDVVA